MNRNEHEELRRSGAKPQPNSGRGPHRKGDGIADPFCIDVKEYGKSYSITYNGWAKVCTDAMRAGSYEPAIKVDIGNKVRVYVIGETMFDQMREAWLEKYGTL